MERKVLWPFGQFDFVPEPGEIVVNATEDDGRVAKISLPVGGIDPSTHSPYVRLRLHALDDSSGYVDLVRPAPYVCWDRTDHPIEA